MVIPREVRLTCGPDPSLRDAPFRMTDQVAESLRYFRETHSLACHLMKSRARGMMNEISGMNVHSSNATTMAPKNGRM